MKHSVTSCPLSTSLNLITRWNLGLNRAKRKKIRLDSLDKNFTTRQFSSNFWGEKTQIIPLPAQPTRAATFICVGFSLFYVFSISFVLHVSRCLHLVNFLIPFFRTLFPPPKKKWAFSFAHFILYLHSLCVGEVSQVRTASIIISIKLATHFPLGPPKFSNFSDFKHIFPQKTLFPRTMSYHFSVLHVYNSYAVFCFIFRILGNSTLFLFTSDTSSFSAPHCRA